MSFWSNLFSSSKDRFSLDELQRLHSVLLRNQVVTDGNRDTVVETLRAIAELTIWGDQHDSLMVEYFLTENMLGHFHQILLQRSARRGTVAIQVLQTLSILIQNIRNQQTIYYLFSNDHINNIAALKFDFEDDEVLGYYVNLLKTISLKLNETTVQFFFRAGGAPSSGGSNTPRSAPGTPSSFPASFPLYTEAVKFIAHRDGMVRAAVKTLALNVFAIPLPSLRNFLSSPPADSFFDQLATYTAERCIALDRLLSSWDATAPRMAATVETYLAEIEDILTFCNDVIAVGVPALSSMLLRHLWKRVVGPVLFWPLLGMNSSEIEEPREDVFTTELINSVSLSSPAAAVVVGVEVVGKEAVVNEEKSLVGPLCSLYALERALYAVTDPLLSSFLVSALLGGSVEEDAAALDASLQIKNNSPENTAAPAAAAAPSHNNNLVFSDLVDLHPLMTASDFLQGLRASSATYRTRVLSMLRGGDAQLSAAVVRLVAAVLNRKTLPEETVEAVGLLPRRRRKQRKLLEELTRDASSERIPPLPPPPPLEPKLKPQLQPSSPGSPGSGTGGGAGTMLRRYSPTDESVLHISNTDDTPAEGETTKTKTKTTIAAAMPSTASTVQGDENFNEMVESLLIALNLDLLPPLALPIIGWALHRLLSSDTGPAELTTKQNELLEKAWKRRKEALTAVCAGPWGDTVVPMIVQIWGKVREKVLRIGPGPVHVAGHTWVQAVLLHELHWQLGGGGGRSTDSLTTAARTAANTVAEEVTASNFAIAAKVATIRVAAAVAVGQVHSVMMTGEVPLHIFSSTGSTGSTSTHPSSTVLGDIAAREIREGSVVPLPQINGDANDGADGGDDAVMQCKVAFSKGVERVVLMHVLGMPQIANDIPADNDIVSGTEKAANEAKNASVSSPSSLFSLTLSSPVVAILDPGTGSTLGYGTVLSVAPLLSAVPAVDSNQPHWLHVHVRPQRSALLRLLGPDGGGGGGGASSGAELAAMDQQLAEGHWVLAFPDGDAAKRAAEKVIQSARVLREVHQKALEPLLKL